MRLTFADIIPWDYRVDTPYRRPLGGSQSALCYLAEALAELGHEVSLLTFTTEPGRCRGVECLSLHQPVSLAWLHSQDAVILLNSAGQAQAMRQQMGPKTRLILWTQHAHDQPAMQALHDPQERDSYDAIVVISNWQRDQFHAHFGIEFSRMHVLRNAIGPAFRHLFPEGASILSAKERPAVLAYTSTPFRGLEVLLELFPLIRAAVPGVTLKVFSSMKVYQIPQTQDEAEYGRLYRLCREIEGVEHIGSLPQPELARQLRSVSVLAYPNIFPETGCIAAMEAMASGCLIVTSDLGALPETTAGFARLIPILGEDGPRYKDRFGRETIAALQTLARPDASDLEAHLQQQVAFINHSVTWSQRAREWSDWLEKS